MTWAWIGKAILWAALWTSCGSVAFCVPNRQNQAAADPKLWFQKGQRALQEGNLSEAEMAFRQVLLLDPKAGAAYANLGVIEMRRKNWDESLKNLKKAQTLSPNIPGIRLNIGLAEFRRGNYREAIPVLESVVREEPDAVQPRYLLGLCQVFTEDYEGAVKTLGPLWGNMSSDVMYLYVLDMAADKSGNRALDEKAMKQLVAAGGDTAEFHLILAKAHLQHHEEKEALEELKKVEAMNPSMPFLHFNLGYAYLGTGQYQKSEAEFRKDITIDPDLADNYYQLGVLYSLMQRQEESANAFREALRLEPHRSGAWFGLGKIYNEQGNFLEALKALDEALKTAPDSYNVHLVRAQVLQRLGRQEEAKREFAGAKKLLDAKVDRDREDLNKAVPSPELKETPN